MKKIKLVGCFLIFIIAFLVPLESFANGHFAVNKHKIKGIPTGFAVNPTNTDLYNKAVIYLASPKKHSLTTTPSASSIPITINSTKYYFTPKHGEDTLLLQYMAGNASAVKVTTSSSKAVFSYDSTMYTFNTSALKQSSYIGDDYTLTKTVYGIPAYGGEHTVNVYILGNEQTVTAYEGIDDKVGEACGTTVMSSGSIDYDFVGSTRTGGTGGVGGFITVTGDVDYIRSNFIGNTRSHTNQIKGGMIYNNKGNIEYIVGDFIGNVATGNNNRLGGVIYNEADSTIGAIIGDFIGNYTYSSTNAQSRGNIWNKGTISYIHGNFINNVITSEGNKNGGGAIWNEGANASVTVVDSNFIGNVTKSYGGAIYNNSASTLNILAINSDSVFSGNIAQATSITREEDGTLVVDGGKYNAINTNLDTCVVNMNAAKDHKIVFDDAVTGGSGSGKNGILNLNKALTTSDDKIAFNVSAGLGTIVFNNDTIANTINLYSGVMNIGKEGNISTSKNFYSYGGAVSTQNNDIGTKSLGNVNMSADLGLMIDLDLTGVGSGDIITSSNELLSSEYKIILNAINIIDEGSTNKSFSIQIADDYLKSIISLPTSDITISGGNGTYTNFLYDNGYLNFDAVYPPTIESIYSAVSSLGDVNYTLKNSDSMLTSGNLGSMSGDRLAITGGGKSVNGNENSGISVGASKVLTINNSTWINFKSTGNGAVINNSGVAEFEELNFVNNVSEGSGGAIHTQEGGVTAIKDSIFSGNSAVQGGAIANDGTITIKDSSFVNNNASTNGGAVYNTGTMTIIADTSNVSFTGNKANGEANDIHNESTLNIQAKSEKTVVLLGSVTDKGLPSGTINIGGTYVDDYEVTQNYSGSVTFNNTVSQAAVNVISGMVNFNDVVSATDLSNVGVVNVCASDLNITEGVVNNGTLNLSEGVLNSAIIGTGETVIKEDVTTNADITQDTLTVENSLTINPNKIVTVNNVLNNSSTILNNGNIVLAGGNTTTKLVNAGTISGTGITTISGVVDNSGMIISTTTGEDAGINITGSLTTSADNIVSANYIANTGTVNFASGETQSVISGTGTININGDAVISKAIIGNEVVLNDGTTAITTTGSISDANSLKANGGGISLVDNVASNVNLGNLLLNEDLNLSMDMNFADNNADVISGSYNINSVSGKQILLKTLHIVNALASEIETSINVVNSESNLKSYVKFADDINIDSSDITDNFLLSYNSITGDIDVVFIDITKAVLSSVPTRIYNITKEELVTSDLGVMGGEGASLTINGNGHVLKSSNKSGISVVSGQTLNVNNLTVSGMSTAITNNSGGKVNIKDSTFAGNNVDIHNEGELNVRPTENNLVTFNGVIEDNNSVKTGVLTVDGAGTVNFNNSVTQKQIKINNGTANFNVNVTASDLSNAGTVNVSASDLNITNDILNSGTLNLSEGNLNSSISGTGNTNIIGNMTNNVSITQKDILISSGVEFANSGDINSTGTLTNEGKIDSIKPISAGVLNNSAKAMIIGSGNITAGGGTNNGDISTTGSFTNTGEFTNNSAISSGTFNNSGNFINNTSENSKVFAGSFVNDGTFSTSTTGIKTNNDIVNNANLIYTSGYMTTNNITGSPTGNVVFNTGDSIIINNTISGTQVTLGNSTISFGQSGDISQASQFNVNGGRINVANGVVSDINLGNVVMNNDTNLVIDFDLSKMTSDTFTTTSLTTNGHKFNISDLNLIGKTMKTNFSINLASSTKLGEANVTSKNMSLSPIMSPIKKLEGHLENGILTYTPVGNSWKDYNPAILTAPVAAQLGGYLTQLNTYDEAFQNLDMKMLMTCQERKAAKFANRFAAANGDEMPMVYSPIFLPEKESGLWARPYATFERVNLSGGPKVSNILYGSFFGGDTKMYELKHGWDFQGSFFVGYTGSHQAFRGNDIYQNGGTFGVTGIWYKGNFFTALTANVGASVADVSTKYGSEDFPMLMSGVAWKTGYNWELFNSKFIIQPSYMMSYSFIHTFNYTSAAGARITSDPLHAINITPGLKFIANLKNGWQPYITLCMVWNIMDKTDFRAANISLPDISVRPYFQYGVGIQKRWGDRFTGYFQTVLRSGGRNGVALSLGFRWAIGKNNKPVDKLSVKTEIKK